MEGLGPGCVTLAKSLSLSGPGPSLRNEEAGLVIPEGVPSEDGDTFQGC